MHSSSEASATSAILPARLPKGFELGDVVIDGWVRDGGMAAIYRAHRASDGTRVAFKLQLPSTAHLPEICDRFEREAQAMRRVAGDPHIVELFESDVLEDGRRYFVMEWIEGENLEEFLDFLRNQDQRFPVWHACIVGQQIAQGLATVHAQRLVHCDLKPANVMVGKGEQGQDRIQLVDFGIVADLGATDLYGAHHADDGEVMGTSAYMAPEQALGHRPEPSIDLFALGVVLYEALSGACIPPDGWTPETLPSLQTLRKGLPQALENLVRACMSSDPALRPRTAADVAAKLEIIGQQAALFAASAEEPPSRTGATVLTPKSDIAALEESAVRKGGTEVALTHEEAILQSGVISRPPSEVLAVRRSATAPAPVGTVAPLPLETVGPDPERQPIWRWWWVAVLVLLVGAGGAWVGMPGGEPREAKPGSGEAIAVTHPPSVAVAADPDVVDRVEPNPTAAASPDLGSGADSGSEAASPTKRDSPPTVPDQDPVANEDTAPKAAVPKAPKRPDKAACAAMRERATKSKAARDWNDVIAATRKSSCWPGKAKVERRRLQVKAYLELHRFADCVRKGGKSKDPKLKAHLDFCKRRLEQ